MNFSSLPFQLAIVLGFLGGITHRAVRLGKLKPDSARGIYGVLIALGIWSAISSGLALSGFYTSSSFYALLPGLWFPLVPMSICAIPFLLSTHFRQALRILIDTTPPTWFIYLQAMRIAALGTLYKTFMGAFPLHVELGIGVTDLCFGFSALYVAHRLREKRLSYRALAIWNLIGAAIIIIPAGILIQMGLPGPMQVFSISPTTEVMFEFPLVLAPTIVVPLLVVMNGIIAWRLIEYGISPSERVSTVEVHI